MTHLAQSPVAALIRGPHQPLFDLPVRVTRAEPSATTTERPGPTVAELTDRLRQLDAPLAPSGQPADHSRPWEAAVPSDPADPTQTPEMALRTLMADVGVPERLAASLTDAALACASVESSADPSGVGSAPASLARANEMLSAVETVTQLSTHLEAVMISATSWLSAETGKLLLADKSLTDPADLSQSARDRWRSRTKSLTRHEIEAAIGWCAGEVIDLVALANAPSAVTRHVLHALRNSEASWSLARRFFRACSGLAHEDTAAIATALFGDDPAAAVTERLTSDGEWTGEPWHHKEFNRALDREVAKIKARDPEAEAKSRQAARDRADVRVNLDDAGGAEVAIGCLTLQGAAIADRIEHAARAIRQAGDPRPLPQLRSAVATALLLHGTVDLGGLSGDPDTITVEQSAQLAKVLHGLPTADLNVIVPFTMLAGATMPTCSCHGPTTPPDPASPDPASPDRSPLDRPPPDQPPPDQASPDHVPPCHAPHGHMPPDSPTATDGIAEVVGRHSAFLSTHDVHELMLTPGSVLHRLVTDPTTGRCLERSTTAYRFTAAQRAQIIAADRFCRAPGCLHPGARAQIDHVQEHGTPGGETREANGQLAHEAHHDLKTKNAWQATINETREVTWTTLLGRIYRTKAHDHRQYTALLRSARDSVDPDVASSDQDDSGAWDQSASGDQGDSGAWDQGDSASDRAAAIDRAIYTALSYRPAGGALLADDDWDESDRQFLGWGLISLSHGAAQGRRRYGPHPNRVATERRRHGATERRRHAATATPSSPGGPGATQTSSSTHETPLQVDPALYEGAPRLDDATLLDGPPAAPPPDDFRRYTRPPWQAGDDEPPPF